MNEDVQKYSNIADLMPCNFGQILAEQREIADHTFDPLPTFGKSSTTMTRLITKAGDVRVGPLHALPAILSEMGVDPRRALAEVDLDPRVFDDPENRASFEVLGGLLATCVTLTGCRHFGLLVGERFEMQNFGLLGELMRHSATVGDAIRHLILNLHLYDRGAAPVLLTSEPATVLLGYAIYHHGAPAADQIQDLAITVGYRILKSLCGPHWKPLHMQFAHNPPENIVPYRRIFQSNIRFNAEVTGIEFASAWLDKPIADAVKVQHDLIQTTILQHGLGAMSFAEQVEAALPQMLLSGMASSEAVARVFAIHERTLRRRLESEGKNLQQLTNLTRFELAKQLLHNTGLSVAVIAKMLHYDDPTAFSRAFRSWANLSPKQWRDQVP